MHPIYTCLCLYMYEYLCASVCIYILYMQKLSTCMIICVRSNVQYLYIDILIYLTYLQKK